MLLSALWLRRQTILIIKGTVEFAVIEQTCTCFLSGESSICEYIYFFLFPWVLFGWLFDAQLTEACYHSIPEPKKIPEGYGGRMSMLYTNRVMTVTSGHCSSFIQLRYRNTSFPTLAVLDIPQSPGLREMWEPPCTTLGPTHPGHSRVTRWHWALWLWRNHNLTLE